MRKKKRVQRAWSRASPLMSGVKDRAVIEKGGIGILDAALNLWAAKKGIYFGGQWNRKKK